MAHITAVVGLGFGDEGKGSVVDFLCRHHLAKLVVRFNGGAQAGHNVVLEDGRHHTFSQFGSGTFAGAETHLSRFMLVNPVAMLNEELGLQSVGVSDAFERLTIDESALITTPFHIAANRLRELARGQERHGSCGMGIGETVAYAIEYGSAEAIRVVDLWYPRRLRNKLQLAQQRLYIATRGMADVSDTYIGEHQALTDAGTVDRCLALYEEFAKRGARMVDSGWLRESMRSDGHVIFEGAQGALLDEIHGFHPHTTWSDCTFGNVNRLLDGTSAESARRLGVCRAFMTRHGAGPFPTEFESECDRRVVSHDHNKTGPWQGAFRSGALDLALLRHALSHLRGIDGLCMTNVDRLHILGDDAPVCERYQDSAAPLDEADPVYTRLPSVDHMTYARTVSGMLGVPLALVSSGPTAADKTLE